MKIKNILFVSLFAGAVLSSCDYTDLSPIDSITDKTYWTTTNDLKLYANGLYGLLASPTATGDNTVTTLYRKIIVAICLTNIQYRPRHQAVMDGIGMISAVVTISCSVIKPWKDPKLKLINT